MGQPQPFQSRSSQHEAVIFAIVQTAQPSIYVATNAPHNHIAAQGLHLRYAANARGAHDGPRR
ncbi:MAG: hypothetical protein EBS41_05330 [Actinobacteria bacterium]|nr:hypothetical protein [Actinomycetota bacterium]